MKGERDVRSKLRRLLADEKERLTGTLGWHGTVIDKECTLQLCEPPTRRTTHLSRLERERGQRVDCSSLLRSVAALQLRNTYGGSPVVRGRAPTSPAKTTEHTCSFAQ